MAKVFIHREEGEWQILGFFKSIEQAKQDLSDDHEIDPNSWSGPEDVNGTPWWTSGDNYIIGYDLTDVLN